MREADELTYNLMKLAVSCGGASLVWYFAGPFCGEIGRALFEGYYLYAHGPVNPYNVHYWTEFVPLRGHAHNYAFTYGNLACAAFAAPLLYKLPDIVVSAFKRCRRRPPVEAQLPEQVTETSAEVDMNNKLKTVIDGLQANPHEDRRENEPKSAVIPSFSEVVSEEEAEQQPGSTDSRRCVPSTAALR